MLAPKPEDISARNIYIYIYHALLGFMDFSHFLDLDHFSGE